MIEMRLVIVNKEDKGEGQRTRSSRGKSCSTRQMVHQQPKACSDHLVTQTRTLMLQRSRLDNPVIKEGHLYFR